MGYGWDASVVLRQSATRATAAQRTTLSISVDGSWEFFFGLAQHTTDDWHEQASTNPTAQPQASELDRKMGLTFPESYTADRVVRSLRPKTAPL